jgi:predicted TIM-barrel enzyme
MGSAAVWAMTAPSIYRPPRKRRADEAVALRADGADSIISHPQHTRSNQPSGRETASLRRDASLIFAQMALKTRGNLTDRLIIATAGPTPDQRMMQTGKISRQFRMELKDFAG